MLQRWDSFRLAKGARPPGLANNIRCLLATDERLSRALGQRDRAPGPEASQRADKEEGVQDYGLRVLHPQLELRPFPHPRGHSPVHAPVETHRRCLSR